MLSSAITRELELALRNLRYGSIQMVVHDGNVVRIERIERIRLPAPPENFGGAQAGLTDFSEAQRTSRGQPTPPTEVCQDAPQEG